MSITALIFNNYPEQNNTELHEAISANDLQEVKKLLAGGANVHHIGDWGCTPLEHTSQLGFLEIVNVLLQAGANPEFGVSTYPLSFAIEIGQLDIVSLLIEAGVNVNQKLENNHTFLMEAAISSNLDIVTFLVEMGANVNVIREDGATALMCAAMTGQLDIFKYLVPLTFPELREKASQKLSNGLLYRQRKDDKLTEAFIFASGQGQTDVLREAIYKGINVNATDSYGNTALCLAAYWGKLDTVRILLKSGANLEQKDEQNAWTPLIAAIRLGQFEIVKLLIESGANIHTIYKGKTSLVFAINYAVNKKIFGTSLFPETSFRHIEIIKFLIEKGVDVNIKDEFGMTAFMIAKQNKKTEIIELIQKMSTKNKKISYNTH